MKIVYVKSSLNDEISPNLVTLHETTLQTETRDAAAAAADLDWQCWPLPGFRDSQKKKKNSSVSQSLILKIEEFETDRAY
jgi:hypothetical protein